MALQWGICGAGLISSDFCSASLKTLPPGEHEITAIAARSAQRARVFADKFDIKTVYGSYDDIANNKDIDVVYIGITNNFHVSLSKQMLNTRHHVLCEKPMAYNQKEVSEVYELAKEKKKFFMEASVPEISGLKEQKPQREKQLSRLVTAQFCKRVKNQEHWIFDRDQGGGCLLTMGIYPVQIASLVFNNEKPEKITAFGNLNERGVDLDSSVMLQYRNGGRAVLNYSTKIDGKLRAEVLGTEGCIEVLVTLRYLAKGDYQSEVADLHGISQPSCSRIIHRVCDSINRQLANIVFPTNEDDIAKLKQGFHRLASFPNVVGAIDGTLIPIQGMGGDDEATFICRKGFHAVNVQAVVDHHLRFTNIVAKWPGSTHDSFVLNNSALYHHMELHKPGWLLGDSGYPLKPWLMTPILNPVTNAEIQYNKSHAITRNVVERAFGVLKQRFRCLHKTGGAISYKAERSIKIIEATFRLHNMAINEGIPMDDSAETPQLMNNPNLCHENNNRAAMLLRDNIIQRF